MTRRGAIGAALLRLAPLIPDWEKQSILDHAVDSPGLAKASPEAAAWLSAVAWIRHSLTEYDDLLNQGYDRDAARHFTCDAINAVLAEWGCRKRIDAHTPAP